MWAALFYAMSFAIPENRDAVLPYGLAVAASSVVAWLVFVPLVALLSRTHRTAAADACVAAMGWGSVLLAVIMLGNVLWFRVVAPGTALSREGLVVHMASLAVGNVALLAFFIRRMRGLGLPPPVLSILWFIVLDGVFILTARGLLASGYLSL